MKQQTALERLGRLAGLLDSSDFLDASSADMRRDFRSYADIMRRSLENELGDLTPPLLLAFRMGAAFQAGLGSVPAAVRSVLGGGQHLPDSRLSIVVAYLARDLLAGERVE